MRFLIFLTAIVVGLGWAGWKMWNRNPLLPPAIVKPAALEKTTTSEDLAGVSPIKLDKGSSAAGGSAVRGSVLPPPAEVRTVRFLYRELPGQDWLRPWEQYGLHLAVDTLGRVITVAGSSRPAVESFVSAAGALDVPTESCMAAVWAVWVSADVEAGWDLLGALTAVMEGDISVEAGAGNVVISAGADQISAALRVICDGERVEAVQRPYVVLTSEKPATVEAAQEIPIPKSTVSNGISQTSIEYRKVGLVCNLKPRFPEAGKLVLEVDQTSGMLGADRRIEGVEIPVIESQRVSSTVLLDVGKGVCLGGVQSQRERRLRGLLRDKTEKVNGHYYVLVATAPLVPRAVPVGPLADWFPLDEFPAGPPMVLPPP